MSIFNKMYGTRKFYDFWEKVSYSALLTQLPSFSCLKFGTFRYRAESSCCRVTGVSPAAEWLKQSWLSMYCFFLMVYCLFSFYLFLKSTCVMSHYLYTLVHRI